ncbi:PIG-L deacetylase family protein [Nonomuraea sp. NPDC050451]|uniref:PIG-L deacetylase family protein n=1 Tax=Nonomuraea sp. NPDC050451 TaxID=3364364 RepID=UPI00379FEF45
MSPRRVLVIAPHPDDEVLGAGATMCKLAEAGAEVSVVIVSRAQPPRFPAELGRAGVDEARKAHDLLGVANTTVLDFPIAELDQVSHADMNAQLLDVFSERRPDVVFLPFGHDLFLDHQRVSLSALVCARPIGAAPPAGVYGYETLSQSNWNAPWTPRFSPTAFVDVAAELDRKVAAMECFASQIRPFPHERSSEAIRALATLRGAQFGCHAAEAFVTIRQRMLG